MHLKQQHIKERQAFLRLKQQHIKERQAILASEAAAHQGKAGFLASEAVPFAPAELDHLGLAQRVLTQPEVIRAI